MGAARRAASQNAHRAGATQSAKTALGGSRVTTAIGSQEPQLLMISAGAFSLPATSSRASAAGSRRGQQMGMQLEPDASRPVGGSSGIELILRRRQDVPALTIEVQMVMPDELTPLAAPPPTSRSRSARAHRQPLAERPSRVANQVGRPEDGQLDAPRRAPSRCAQCRPSRTSWNARASDSSLRLPRSRHARAPAGGLSGNPAQ